MKERRHGTLSGTLLQGAALGLAGGIADRISGRERARGRGPLLQAALVGAAVAVARRALGRRGAVPRPRMMKRPAGPALGRSEEQARAFRLLNAGAGALSFSVLADSAIEHFRGGFYNPAMFVAPAVSALTLGAGASAAAGPPKRSRNRDLVFATAAATGLVGFGFHIYNISTREGGWNWLNLFYGAPLAAPLGIHMAGLFGLAAPRVLPDRRGCIQPKLAGLPAGRTLAALSAVGLVGTAAEAGLLHFRGAFQDPFMFVPVTLPPLAAVALGAAAARPSRARSRLAGALLGGTALAGLAGMGFHTYGVHRSMGGWKNWRQNLQVGPPIPAPPSFTGLALTGLAGLALLPGGAARRGGGAA